MEQQRTKASRHMRSKQYQVVISNEGKKSDVACPLSYGKAQAILKCKKEEKCPKT
jgi:hypothetical protein